MKSGSEENGVRQPGPRIWQAGTLTYTSAGLVILFLWLLAGDFAWSMRDRSVGPMAQWYLKNLGVSNLLYGLLISSFPALIGLILNPIVGVKSDRHRGKRGRRIPFLLVTTPIATFGMIGLALTPLIAGGIANFCTTDPAGASFRVALESTPFGTQVLGLMQSKLFFPLLCFGIFWTAFEIATIAGQAVIGGLINDVVPRSLLGRFYGLFRAVSLIDGMIFNFWLVGLVPTYYTVILLSIGLFYCAAFLLMCFKVREGKYPDPPPREPARKIAAEISHGTRAYFRECFFQPYYVSVFLMLMAANLAFVPVNTFSVPFAVSLDSFKAWGICVGWTYVTSAAAICSALAHIVISPLVGTIIDRTGNVYRYTFFASCLLAVIALALAWYAHGKFMKLGGPKNYTAPE